MKDRNRHERDWKDSPRVDPLVVEQLSATDIYNIPHGYFTCAICFKPIYFLREEYNEYSRKRSRGNKVVQIFTWRIHKGCDDSGKKAIGMEGINEGL